jgi:hypothetical protein
VHDLHARGQFELVDNLVQERHAPSQRVDQIHDQVSAPASEHDARQSRSTADIDDPHADRQQVRHNRTVEQVPIPQPRDLARPDQPANDAVAGQSGRVALHQLQPLAEQLLRGWRGSDGRDTRR